MYNAKVNYSFRLQYFAFSVESIAHRLPFSILYYYRKAHATNYCKRIIKLLLFFIVGNLKRLLKIEIQHLEIIK